MNAPVQESQGDFAVETGGHDYADSVSQRDQLPIIIVVRNAILLAHFPGLVQIGVGHSNEFTFQL
jgi:hypothetical protein